MYVFTISPKPEGAEGECSFKLNDLEIHSILIPISQLLEQRMHICLRISACISLFLCAYLCAGRRKYLLRVEELEKPWHPRLLCPRHRGRSLFLSILEQLSRTESGIIELMKKEDDKEGGLDRSRRGCERGPT